MKNPGIKSALAAAASTVVLTACGGGGSDTVAYDPVTASAPSQSAGTSAQGFLDFIASLSTTAFDSREAFDLTAFVAPTDDADSAPPRATSIDQ